MKILAAFILFTFSISAFGNPRSVQSSSGKFKVIDMRPELHSQFRSGVSSTSRAELIRLEPEVLAISSDRIREAFLRKFAFPNVRSGSISLYLHSSGRGQPNIRITSTLYPDGWRHDMALPDEVDPIRLIRAIIQVSLLEIAHSGSVAKAAEIPFWLIEGGAASLNSEAGPDLVLQSIPTGLMRRSVRESQKGDPLAHAREQFRSRKPLSFEELNMPTAELLSGDNQIFYRNSAHFFIEQLLQLPQSRAGLLKMVQLLPRYWNSQTAFLQAFQPYFGTVLDVEKWWTVSLLDFMGRDVRQVWVWELSLEKLQEILISPAQIRHAPDQLPVLSEVTLAQIISEWEWERQWPILRQKLLQLTALRNQSPMELVPLIDGYRLALEHYLHKRQNSGSSDSAKRMAHPNAHRGAIIIQQTLQEMVGLDFQREELRRRAISVASPSKPKE
jgi:hypothetical protein